MTKQELQNLAFELADEAARCDIESNCVSAVRCSGPDHGLYWDTSSATEDEKHYVTTVVSYLEARKKLRRWPDKPELVKVHE